MFAYICITLGGLVKVIYINPKMVNLINFSEHILHRFISLLKNEHFSLNSVISYYKKRIGKIRTFIDFN